MSGKHGRYILEVAETAQDEWKVTVQSEDGEKRTWKGHSLQRLMRACGIWVLRNCVNS